MYTHRTAVWKTLHYKHTSSCHIQYYFFCQKWGCVTVPNCQRWTHTFSYAWCWDNNMIAQHIHTAAVGLKTLNLSMKFTVTLLQKVVTEDFITLRHTSKYLEEKAPYTATIYCTSKTECYKIPYKKRSNCCWDHWWKKTWIFKPLWAMKHLTVIKIKVHDNAIHARNVSYVRVSSRTVGYLAIADAIWGVPIHFRIILLAELT